MRPHPSPPNKRGKRTYSEIDDFSNQILVASISQSVKVSSVAQYFENFGQIESIQLCLEQRFGYGVVQFKSAESARDALHKRFHKIEKHVVAVYPDNCQQTLSNVNKISALSDECLMKIFDRLDEFGLCAVANTCTRFKRLAEKTFSESKKFYQIELDKRYNTYAANKILFETFSHLVKNLRIVAEVYEDDNLTENFTEYPCDGLKYLELRLYGVDHCITLHDDIKQKLKLIFSRLEHLNFVNDNALYSKTARELLSSCLELKSIEVDSVRVCKNVHFPKLEKLEIHECSEAAFENVLSLNRGIKKLRIYGENDECAWNICTVIARYLPHLEKLSFGRALFDEDADCNALRKLIHLKKIDVTDDTAPVFNAIYDAAIPIESLELAIDDKTISRKVLKMKSIKKLLLERYSGQNQDIDDAYLLALAKNLPLLTKLSLYNINVITISGLKRMLKCAKNLMSLELYGTKKVKKTDKQRLKMFIEKHCGGRDISIEIDDYNLLDDVRPSFVFNNNYNATSFLHTLLSIQQNKL